MSTDITLIAAMDRNRAIGRDNAMPWHLRADLQRFKSLTLGMPVLLGRRTAEAIGMALPGRDNLVLTRSGRAPYANQQAVGSLEEALELAGKRELMVAGGGEIYALTLPLARRMHLTLVDTAIEAADAWFPQFEPAEWNEYSREHHAADQRHAFAFDWVDFERCG